MWFLLRKSGDIKLHSEQHISTTLVKALDKSLHITQVEYRFAMATNLKARR